MPVSLLPTVSSLFLPSLGPMEIFIFLVIVLILFGPGKLPQVFGALGEGVRQFKKASREVNEELSRDDSKAPSNTGNEEVKPNV